MGAVHEFRGETEEAIIDRIEGGESIAQIAQTFDCNRSVLWRWLEADAQRSARASQARSKSAAAWDDKAETELRSARDPFELSRAKELAHHYRWRASKIAPREYGDKIEHEHKGGLTVTLQSGDEAL